MTVGPENGGLFTPGDISRLLGTKPGPPPAGAFEIGYRPPDGEAGFALLRKRPEELWPALHPIGRPPASGPAADSVSLEQNPDYPADRDLVFDRGGFFLRLRLTPADQDRVRRELAAPVPADLAELRRQARAAGLSGQGHGTALADEVERLVNAAHAAGYRLADDDHRLTYRDEAGVREFLEDLIREHAGRAQDFLLSGDDQVALRRVIALLEAR